MEAGRLNQQAVILLFHMIVGGAFENVSETENSETVWHCAGSVYICDGI